MGRVGRFAPAGTMALVWIEKCISLTVRESVETMAQKVNITLVDDLDGNDADETVTFGLDGVEYEIDLSAGHAQQLREALGVYVGHARRSGGRKRSRSSRTSSNGEGTSAAELREWGRANGYEVSERGRVSSDLREAYHSAH